MEKYEIAVKKFSALQGKIEIPRFQRGLVWNKTKKREFIKSLKAGLPIGVLLLSQEGDKYLIIDGLQRFTTMMEYAKNFFGYIDKSEISDLDLQSIVVASREARDIFEGFTLEAKNAQFDNMRDIIVQMITEGYGKNANVISSNIARELCRKIAPLPDKDYADIQNAVYTIVEKVFKQAKIDDINIPMIIFKGSKDELANIFQKLNQEGVKLSKYDVFAASWINKTVTVRDDPTFIDYIIKKYDESQRESDLEIESYDPDEMKQKGELTVFEYAFALGKAIMGKCKKLFPKSDDSKIDSIGFIILAELLGLTYQNMGDLATKLTSYRNLDAKKLKDAILEASSFVETALVPYIESPSGTGTKRVSLACHSELQLASYIIVVFKLKYELTSDDGLKSKPQNRDLKRVKDYLYKHYLFDILRSFWSGSGDTKLEDIIADPTTCRYTKDVAKSDFETALSGWLDEGMKKAEMKNVSAETKLFLNYLLRLCVPNADRCSYDVEHCVPKDVVKKYYLKKNKIVPMSSPCNLVYIPTSDNRSKGEQTYYQRQTSDPGTFTLNVTQLDQLCYPTRQELSFVEATSTMTEDAYFAYLRSRKNTLSSKLIDALYPQ